MHELMTTNDYAQPGKHQVRFRLRSRPIRTVLAWQAAVTAVATVIAGIAAGTHGALSAALGGAVSIGAGIAFVLMASLGRAKSTEGVLFVALRAEAVKLGLIITLPWLVLATYKDAVVAVFLAVFALTAVIFALAFFVRES